jgi:hypothetical protein
MKLKYFKEAIWASKDYIQKAKSLAVAAFGAYYSAAQVSAGLPPLRYGPCLCLYSTNNFIS